jgi:HAMP domain-containing protein
MKILYKMLLSFVSIVLIFGIIMTIVASNDSQREQKNLVFLYEERGVSIAKTLDSTVESDAQLQTDAQTILDTLMASDLGVTEISIHAKAPEGQTESGYWRVASSDKSIVHTASDPEDLDAITTDKYNVIFANEDGLPIIDVTYPLHDASGKAFATTGIKFDMTAIQSHMMPTKVIFISLFTTLVAIIATFVVANSITKPITHLKDVADNVSMGDLQQTVTITGDDEIGELAQSFQRMINAFKISQALNEEECGSN